MRAIKTNRMASAVSPPMLKDFDALAYPLAYLPATPAYLRPAHESDALGDTRFRQLVGEQNWRKLPRTLRRRFSKRIAAGTAICYNGQIIETRMNFAGHLLAQAARLIGAPLPLESNNGGQPAIVTVMDDPEQGGQIWTRIYGRKGGMPQTINSKKKFGGVSGLEEQIGGGLLPKIIMALRLETRWNKLVFISERYYVKAFGRRFTLPRWLTPGTLTVGHEDLGAGWFTFTLTIDHPLLGRLLQQKSQFQDPTTQEAYHG